VTINQRSIHQIMKTETLDSDQTTISPVATTAFADGVSQNPPITQLKNILVPLDFSERSLKALKYAVPFAKIFGAKVTLLHVVNGPIYTAGFSLSTWIEQAQLSEIEQQLEDMLPPEVAVDTTVRQCLVCDGILGVALEIGADLIITTTHGHTGLKHLLWGSTAEKIVRGAPCPVLVIHDAGHDFV
jgi:nucleotide-binding universal stress UspA family protein